MNPKLRNTVIGLVAGLGLLLPWAGCSSGEIASLLADVGGTGGALAASSGAAPTSTADESGGTGVSSAPGSAGSDATGTEPTAAPSEGTTGVDTGTSPDTGGSTDGQQQSGVLTAGSFDDNLNLDVFNEFISSLLQDPAAGELPSLSVGKRIIVQVADGQGAPVGDARVVITPTAQAQAKTSNGTLLDQTTGSDGRVLFLTGLDDGSGATSYTLTVYPPDGSAPVVGQQDPNTPEWKVALTVNGTLPAKLDLAFLVDSTGSMGDELEYLKAEVGSIAQGVKDLFPTVVTRYALIVYRDQGDVYVTRPFDFTDSLDTFEENLKAQSSDGGGDEPEAVDVALEEVDKLSWATGDTTRVLFWIADAPPHSSLGQKAFTALLALRAKTIAIYPVAASGAGTELEFYMRTAAFLTLSEYLFLTDDSGIGNPHATPHIPCYQVQRLDNLMLRMIQAQLSGGRIEPDPANVIRTVGNPVNGVCTTEQPATQ